MMSRRRKAIFIRGIRAIVSGLFLTTLGILLIAGVTQASSVDDALAKARKEGRMVMLELGSVGCIPCDMMQPVMAKLSQNYKGKLDVIFVDVKKDRETAKKFGVYIIPVQVFLDRNGKEFHRHVGYYPYERIVPVLREAGL